MSLTHVFESALGQLLALGIVVGSWLTFTIARVLWQFGRAAAQTRIDIVCRERTP